MTDTRSPASTEANQGREWTLSTTFTVGFVVAFALFVMASVAGFREQRHVAESGNWAKHTFDVVDQSQIILRTLADAEDGHRSYLLTGSERYLEPYDDAIRSLPGEITALERTGVDDPAQQRRLFAIRPLVNADLAELESTIELRRSGNAQEATRRLWLRSRADHGTLQRLRILVRDFQDTERNIVQQRIQAGVVRAHLTRECILLATLLGAALAIASLVGMNRQSQRRIVAEREFSRIRIAQQEARLKLEERNRAVSALRAAQLSAEEANRSKDEFLALLSHELRSPLNAILGWVTLLRRGALTSEKTGHALETIERNVHLQAQLVDDLLDVSRIASGKLVLDEGAVDLDAVVRVAIENVRPSADAKGVGLHASLSLTSGAVVLGDEKRLQQVVSNLLTNAVKFTPRRGSIAVKLEAESGEAVLAVTDTGIGIEPEFLPHVFDRFRQADGTMTRKHGGLGLGLSIVRTLTSLHNGRVEATSEGLGRGSTFRVRLPLRDIEPDVSRAGGELESAGLRGVKVVVVEDDEDARDALCLALEQSGAVVNPCASTSEALTLLDHLTPDLIVSDIGMPGEDGYRFMRRVRAREEAHVAAIAVTGFASKEDQEEAARSGFDIHIAKPVLPDVIVAKARDLLERRRAATA